MRPSIHPLLWHLLWPIRLYIRYSPMLFGKYFFTRYVIRPALPASESFIAELPRSGRIQLLYGESLGLAVLLHGSFEAAEIEFLCQRISSSGTAIDVGANVGIFTVVLAKAVGKNGAVLAFEPLASNVERLRRNVAMNNLENVTIYPFAVGETDGEIMLHLANDPAYPSTTNVNDNRGTGQSVPVAVARLDRIWEVDRES